MPKKELFNFERSKLLVNAMTNVSDSVIITDDNFIIKYINKAAEDLFGYSLDELKNKTPGIFNAEPLSEQIQQEMYEKISEGKTHTGQLLNRRKDGSTFICEFKITPIKTEKGKIYAYIGIQRDISKRIKREQNLEFQYRFQKTLAEISSSLFEVNAANLDRKLNNSLAKIGEFFAVDRSYIYQFSKDAKFITNSHEWCNKNISSHKDYLQSSPTNTIPRWVERLSNDEIINIKNLNEMPVNEEKEKKLLKEFAIDAIIIIPMFIDNKLFGFFGFDYKRKNINFNQENIRILEIFTDIIKNAFAKHIAHQRILDLSFKDALTGIYNRRFFEAELERLDTKRQLPLSIIVADVNGLKFINDNYGHQEGDKLIKKTAEILKNSLRKEDILARYGGDEFAILLPNTDKAERKKVLRRIKDKIEDFKKQDLQLSIALGAATKVEIEQDLKSIFVKADDSMYKNKLAQNNSKSSKIVYGLLNYLDMISHETKEHTMRLKNLTKRFAEFLELSISETNRLSLLASLHDIGKVSIPENILNKKSKLSEEEYELLKTHPQQGYKIASSSEEFSIVAEEILTHHEKWDGSGYPKGLSGENIPYLARIIAIVDAYEVMISGRPYQAKMTEEETFAELKAAAGSQFDPNLVKKFLEFIK